jgi:hypothetical protein
MLTSMSTRAISSTIRTLSGEAVRTNENQANVARQVHNERTANGGALTKQQKQQVNQEQNKNSKQIYNEKPNNKTAKPEKDR